MKYSVKHAVNQKKIKQQIALNASKDCLFLFLEWFTGLGKSLAALQIINYHKGSWLIVVKELNHMITWQDEAIKWKISLKDVELISYDSLHKLSKKKSYNIILDEAHAITSLRLKKLQVLNIKRLVALTATMPVTKKMLINKLGNFRYYPINMAKAIEEGIVPTPTIIQLMISLNPAERRKYDNYTGSIWHAMNDGNDDKAKIIGAARKRFLADCKTAYISKHLDYKKRFVCFTGSINQCNEIGGLNVIHSEAKDKLETITKFNELKIDNLFAVNMLRESMNLRNIEVGYIVQLDNQEKSFVQMLGRSFRSINPLVYVFTCKNTVDEGYSQTAFASIPKKYIVTKKEN
jgi:superfamily II DNA or RNA helicase